LENSKSDISAAPQSIVANGEIFSQIPLILRMRAGNVPVNHLAPVDLRHLPDIDRICGAMASGSRLNPM
jgi:hypothetical protein